MSKTFKFSLINNPGIYTAKQVGIPALLIYNREFKPLTNLVFVIDKYVFTVVINDILRTNTYIVAIIEVSNNLPKLTTLSEINVKDNTIMFTTNTKNTSSESIDQITISIVSKT